MSRMEMLAPPALQNGTVEKSDFEKLLDKPVVSKQASEMLAEQLGLPRDPLMKAIRQSIMPAESSEADFMAFIQVCAKYRMNPLNKEIYPMQKKGGGIQIIVGFDGWVTLTQRQKAYDGVTFEFVADDSGTPEMVWCTIYRKDQSHPTRIGERFSECSRGTDPWNTMPFRMLRHKAFIQCARVAFGINGISDEEEGATAAGYESVEEALQSTVAPAGKKKRSLISPGAEETAEPSSQPEAGTSTPPPVGPGDERPAALDEQEAAAVASTSKPFITDEEVAQANAARATAIAEPSPREQAEIWADEQITKPGGSVDALRKWALQIRATKPHLYTKALEAAKVPHLVDETPEAIRRAAVELRLLLSLKAAVERHG